MIKPNINVCVFDTPSCLVITKQKIGTQFIRSVFHEELTMNLVPPEFDITPAYIINKVGGKFEIKQKYPPQINYSEKFNYHLESFYKFLNKSDFDKDVVILIRDPWKRFVSALIQDFIKPFASINNSRIIEVLGQVILSEDKLTWWINNRNEIDMFTKDEDRLQIPSDKFIECFECIVEYILEGWYRGNYPTFSLHNGEYLYAIDLILKSNPNSNKVKIFDIDEVDLNNVFSKYKTNYEKKPKQNSSNILTEITLRALNKFDNIKDKIVSDLNSETIVYNKLKQ